MRRYVVSLVITGALFLTAGMCIGAESVLPVELLTEPRAVEDTFREFRYPWDVAGVKFLLDRTVKRSNDSEYSLSIINTTPSAQVVAWEMGITNSSLFQEPVEGRKLLYELMPGEEYRVRLYYKSEPNDMDVQGLMFAHFPPLWTGGDYWAEPFMPVGRRDADGWRKLEGAIILPKDQVALLTVQLCIKGSVGQVWFDEVEFVRVSR
ncbi:MAG: hypothetical protein PHH90_11270 [Limnochordia bacterium]|nr:hypothetical protein [Limnochordia bacterium]